MGSERRVLPRCADPWVACCCPCQWTTRKQGVGCWRPAYSQVGGNSRQSDGSSISAWHGGTGSTSPHCSAHIGTALRSQASPARIGGQSQRPDRRSQLPPLASHSGAQNEASGPARRADSASAGAPFGTGRIAIGFSSAAPSRASPCDVRPDASRLTGLGSASAAGVGATRARRGDARSNRPIKSTNTTVNALAPKRAMRRHECYLWGIPKGERVDGWMGAGCKRPQTAERLRRRPGRIQV